MKTLQKTLGEYVIMGRTQKKKKRMNSEYVDVIIISLCSDYTMLILRGLHFLKPGHHDKAVLLMHSLCIFLRHIW